MKNRKSTLQILTIIVVSMVMYSCATTKPLATPPPAQEQVVESNKPKLWLQQNFESFPLPIVKENISIYPLDTIRFRGPASFAFISGAVKQIDTMIIVYPLTPGKVVDVARGSDGKVATMNVLYENNSKYPVPFIVNADRTYSVKGDQRTKAAWYFDHETATKVLPGVEAKSKQQQQQ